MAKTNSRDSEEWKRKSKTAEWSPREWSRKNDLEKQQEVPLCVSTLSRARTWPCSVWAFELNGFFNAKHIANGVLENFVSSSFRHSFS